MNDAELQPFRELVSDLRRLASDAERIYAAEIETIIRTRCRDCSRIEQALDGLLGFCYEESMVDLFRTLCRHYFELNPQATVDYVHAYRDMWDNKDVSDE